MVIVFEVPKGYHEDVRTTLREHYSDLIAKVGVSDGIVMRVGQGITEEVPAVYFHVLLKKDLENQKLVAQQFATSLGKNLSMRMTYFHPVIVIAILDKEDL